MSERVKEVTDNSFEKEVLQSNRSPYLRHRGWWQAGRASYPVQWWRSEEIGRREDNSDGGFAQV